MSTRRTARCMRWSAALLCWRNGVKEREKVAELPPGLDELWGGEELAWSLVRAIKRVGV